MARYDTASDIINQAAVECGLNPVTDVFASTDAAFVQLRYLLNTCGRNMVEMFEWEILRREETFTTQASDTGKYPLPADFAYMIDQTGWERRENVPLGGPLSAQQWAYLLGRDLVNYTIYASFRIAENEFWLFPNQEGGGSVPAGLEISYEYISRNWVQGSGAQQTGIGNADQVTQNDDLVLFKPVMMTQYLRAKFLAAKGFDSTKAEQEFRLAWEAATGHNKGNPVLSLGGNRAGIHYLDYYNIPNTNYGGP